MLIPTSGKTSPMAIAVDANDVYYATADAVFKMSASGTGDLRSYDGGNESPGLGRRCNEMLLDGCLPRHALECPSAGGAKPA